MGATATATFAIISDLHCRLASHARDSFLTVGQLRSPSSRHPVEALLDLIDVEHLSELRVDGVLAPGDLTNKACVEGLQQGWDYVLEIGRKLKTSAIVPVIGNHDIDSHRLSSRQPVDHVVRNLRPGFPFSDPAAVQSFFSDGYCVLNVGAAEIVAINTVIDHVDPDSAKRGAFDFERIQRMEDALQHRLTSPLRGAIMHHHPMLHSGAFLEDTDVIPTGDALLASLRRLGCRFVIHGHKHFTRLSYVNGMAVFASGSFSAELHEFGTSVGNTFHILRVVGSQPDDVRGLIHTWVFRYGLGWRRSNENFGFPYLSGFGRKVPLPDVVFGLRGLAESDVTKTRFLETEVLSAMPDTEYLTPFEREQVNQALVPYDLKLADFDDGQLELWRSFRP
jgi:3',5'-cyclic AMP phosphodiesterase CpdA